MTNQVRLTDPSNIKDQQLRTYLNRLVLDLTTSFNALINNENDLTFRASRTHPLTNVAGSITLGVNSSFVLLDATSSGFTVTLPNPLDFKNQFLYLKRQDNSINTVVISGTGPEFPINLIGYNSATLYSDGTNFWSV